MISDFSLMCDSHRSQELHNQLQTQQEEQEEEEEEEEEEEAPVDRVPVDRVPEGPGGPGPCGPGPCGPGPCSRVTPRVKLPPEFPAVRRLQGPAACGRSLQATGAAQPIRELVPPQRAAYLCAKKPTVRQSEPPAGRRRSRAPPRGC
ncbi:hypothetical protein EYF80_057407 [Liparis tanakae]|uniref:Uncharacterized protein n=1 Tax=Liparis tanakae TaxID=230148 RepID=A0A4Z2EVP5_9TELE|nr:hypothetical protein EYF80_057407 [Liparis tanakae]